MKIRFLFILLFSLSRLLYGEDTSLVDLEKKAELKLQENKIYNSIALFKEIIEQNPSYFDSRLGISRAYIILGEYDEALIHVKKAMFLEPSSVKAKILYGRVLTGKGNYKEARALYETIFNDQPNNTDALIAYAELEVASGNIINALSLYKQTLEKTPENQRALISSILLYDSLNNSMLSENYLERILSLYPDNSFVNYIAAKHYYETGNFNTAQIFASRSLDIDPEYDKTIYILGLIYTQKQEYQKAVKLIENFLKSNRNSPDIWYLLGELYIKLNNIDKSLYCFSTALNYNSKDELARIALENTIIRFKDYEDVWRTKYADYHFNAGKDYFTRNYLDQARNEFRRGLLISPHSITGRKLYSNLIKTLGFENKYLSMIQDLVKDIPNDQNLTDEIEIYQSLNGAAVSENWGIDQFTIESPKYNIDLFMEKSNILERRYNEGTHLGKYLVHLFHGFENIESNFYTEKVTFPEAFQIAHNNKSDYFIIFTYYDSERSFTINARVYQSNTGSLLLTLPVFRTGNNKIVKSLQIVTKTFSNNLPEWGNIIDRNFDKVLINLGYIQNTIPGDIFYIIRNEDFHLKSDEIGINYDKNLILGEVVITNTDDLVSEGNIKKYQFFDIINSGDRLIKKYESENESSEDSNSESRTNATDLYKSIIAIP